MKLDAAVALVRDGLDELCLPLSELSDLANDLFRGAPDGVTWEPAGTDGLLIGNLVVDGRLVPLIQIAEG